MVGRCVAEELFTERARHWVAGRDLGVIAGTKSMGLGQFFARFDEDCDGTVAVSETRVARRRRSSHFAREPHGPASLVARGTRDRRLPQERQFSDTSASPSG